MSKDPFEILAEEVALIRLEVERLQRTSLDKEEAKALHGIVVTGVADMRKISPKLESRMDACIREAMVDIQDKTTQAAERAVIESHDSSVRAASNLLHEAENVRERAWRTFGNFWAWIVATGALCACVAILGTVALNGRAEKSAFRNFGEFECSIRGGQEITLNSGGTMCGFPMNE